MAEGPPAQQGGGIREDARDAAKALPQAPGKVFMAVGPTLHYSHNSVQACWLAGLIAFGLVCGLWSQIGWGTFWSFDLLHWADGDAWRLDRFVTTGVSIFEYPWQILVLGLLMGLLAVTPILTAQLMSFSYSLPLIMEVAMLANLPGLALSLCFSCVGVACRPLRFRSRIISVALCMAPQVLYWGLLGAVRGADPMEWGVSFSPWVSAWLVALLVAGAVLAVGHFTRYRPGLLWVPTLVVGLLAVGVFESAVGFDELAYQLHVAKNNPEQVSEFRDHKITEALDRSITDPAVRRYLRDFFYPTEPIPLREELKREIQTQLAYDRWPTWFVLPGEFNYQDRRAQLNRHYDRFISPVQAWWMPDALYRRVVRRRSTSPRMAVALYYKAKLSEYTPDLVGFAHVETLRFVWDYPYERSRGIWYQLYMDFPYSPESLEARWRLARHWAGQGRFQLAEQVIAETEGLVARCQDQLSQVDPADDSVHRLFRKPTASVVTHTKLVELQFRLDRLKALIGPENRIRDGTDEEILKGFVLLNPYELDYQRQLERIAETIRPSDGLWDNLVLAQARMMVDDQARAQALEQLNAEFASTDGGMEALYDLACLRNRMAQSEADPLQKKRLEADARQTLQKFIDLYPKSLLAGRLRENMALSGGSAGPGPIPRNPDAVLRP